MEEDTRYGTNIQNNERKDRGNPEKLFEFVQDRGATSTRLLADPLNIRNGISRTEIRKNVLDEWNTPDNQFKKNSKSAKVFKHAYRSHLKMGGSPGAEPSGDHDD